MNKWDYHTRRSLDLVSSAAALGFKVAKAGTRLGFSATRGLLNVIGSVVFTAVDYAVSRNHVPTPALGGAVEELMSFIEHIALAPIFLGEYITATSITMAHSAVNILAVIIPGGHEASFSFVAFRGLLVQEWAVDGAAQPSKPYNPIQIARGIFGWISLQGVTQEWQEDNFFKHLKEIRVRDAADDVSLRPRPPALVRVTSEMILPGEDRAQIVAAEIGKARAPSMALQPRHPRNPDQLLEPQQLSDAQLKATLRRLSKMVLYGYGGASLWYWGVPLTPPAGSPLARSEEAQMAMAIKASEKEADGNREPPKTPETYSWWDVLLGKHDDDIFNTFNKGNRGQTDVVIGNEYLMPRFWVLTDHSRAQVVLAIRGTMSFNELAVDLTCDTVDFQPARTNVSEAGSDSFPFHGTTKEEGANDKTYQVHSGILKMAKAMGDPGRPVQIAVQEALRNNPEYDLVICGHSLGAGLAGMLGLLWADTSTCRTVESSGLPVGRRTSVYCIAPPCITDIPLALEAKDLIVSFVYSHDAIARLSIGTATDIRNAATWLCDAHEAASVTAPETGTSSRSKASNKAMQKDSSLSATLQKATASTATGSTPSSPNPNLKSPKPSYAAERKPKAERTDSNFEKSTFEGRNCGHLSVTNKAWRWRRGWGKEGDEAWFIGLRKTLEASMRHPKKLYPAGRLLWALRDSDLCAVHQEGANGSAKAPYSTPNGNGKSRVDKLRLFEVEDREKTFSQILWAKDMMSAHLPHKYDSVLHDLL
ncbi:alpha/beta-hydrolase [Cylindrobasidium torrendii FP15055 ss-10]|uniref:sn-1-specific diacylglycerol lipase n=1 Tax=Cylindrobasidium torrendii FP15055 ss-10 TaxID=1314674 RepID=A0A0D7BUA5_9AGAR|nr:alpha/beta-hydrolase [Cylindrobasidium torrendii FP15055 ss-10]